MEGRTTWAMTAAMVMVKCGNESGGVAVGGDGVS